MSLRKLTYENINLHAYIPYTLKTAELCLMFDTLSKKP